METPQVQRHSGQDGGEGGRIGTVVFVAAILLSAALLFALQPLVARLLLPRFGGAAAVWSVALVFFQGALLAGYAYAHLLTRLLAPGLAKLLHLTLLAAGGVTLPIVLRAVDAGSEATSVLLTLAASVGLAFTVMSANAPLLQAWFARSHLAGAHDPYPLYAASNIGSLAALMAYPLAIEPLLTLTAQARLWSLLYGVMAVAIAAAAWLSRRTTPPPLRRRPDWSGFGIWVFLAAVPSAALVAVTAHLTTDVAAAPFLWVLPLALYLLTFIVAFGRDRVMAGGIGQGIFVAALALAGIVLAGNIRLGLLADVLLHGGAFFVLALYLHARLAARRPEKADLTAFYLALSLGGVIGGAGAALLAPALFNMVAEYPLALALAALALPRRGLWVSAALGLVLAVGVLRPFDTRPREQLRGFYGVHTIEETADGHYRTLRHGLEVHGVEAIRDAAGQPVTGKPKPLAFYHEESPISEAIDAVRARLRRPLRVGVVGLGSGAMACLLEPQDALTFYEIDPLVIRLAQDPARFRYLANCGLAPRIVEGDARLRLAAETERFDMLVIDAFSSDAIPTHLMTREALALYRERLVPGGVILLHISNDHLALGDIAAATARSLGLSVLINDEDEDPDARRRWLFQPAVAVLAASRDDFGDLNASSDWAEPPQGTTRAWTDDYANILAAAQARWRER